MDKHTPILITGATGFVGSYLTRLLVRAGYTHLYALRREESSLELLGDATENVIWRTAGLEDYFSLETALEGIDTIIHCAALISFAGRDKQQLLRVNRTGTQHLIDAALHLGVRRMIYVSSVAALGRNTRGQMISEESKWEDGPLVSNYSRSKFFAELEVWRGQAEGISTAVVYPSVILGAGYWSSGSTALFKYAANQPKFYPSGNTGLVDVRDVTQAIQLVLERDQDEDRFLLNGTNLSYHDLLKMMTEALGVASPQRLLPQMAAQLLARIEKLRARLTGSTPLLTPETVRTSYQRYVYDSQRSEATLGLQYRNLEDTIRETAYLYQIAEGKEPKVLDF